MALIACPDCGKQVSTMAASCPHCGYPLQEPLKTAAPTPPLPLPTPPLTAIPATKKGTGCIGPVLALIVVLWAATSISRCQGETAPASEFKASPSANPVTYTDTDRADWLKQMQDETQPAVTRLQRAKAIIFHFPESAESTVAKDALGKLELALVEAERNKPGLWQYSTNNDPMTSKPVRTATVTSDSTFELDFPYKGAQNATLQLRKHPKWGRDVIFAIEKGQLTCDVYECPLRVRFGDGAPVTYMAARANDGSSEVAFINQYEGFTSRMRKVNRVRIEFSVYRGGTIVQEFNVRGFDPSQMQ